MKYLIRSLKYFLHLTILLVIFVAAIYLITAKGAPLESMFRNGYNSLWSMLLIVAVFAAAYPKVGYGKRRIRAKGSTEEILPKIEAHMNARGYVLVSRDAEDNLVFRQASFINRLFKMFEDKVYFTRALSGYEMEGRLKDIVRLDTAFYQIFEETEEN
ncbi:MAG: hypothetical protein J5748_02420 [Bacteroidales bacterium]|nr:hypothetical protein [Bacteroidales bacterium]